MTGPRSAPPPQYGPPPGYGPQPGYGPPPGYGPYGYRGGPPPRPDLRFGLVAVTLAGVGAAMVVLAFAGLDWYSFAGGQTVGDVRHLLDQAGSAANGLAVAYYSWLGWLLLLICTAAAVLAAVPVHGVATGFRIAGPVLAGLATLFTLGSVELTSSDLAGSDALQSFYYGHVAAGFWITLFGFVLIGAGALVGPMRRTPD